MDEDEEMQELRAQEAKRVWDEAKKCLSGLDPVFQYRRYV